MKDALLGDDAADQEGDEHNDWNSAPAHLLEMMDRRGQAEAARMDEHPAAGDDHGAEHVDQGGHCAEDAGDAAANLAEHAGDGHRRRIAVGRGADAADLVDQTGIVRRQAIDPGLGGSRREAAAQPLDQPGAERIEPGDLRHIDGHIDLLAGELLRIGGEPLERRRKRRGPGARRAQRQCTALATALQIRVARHDDHPRSPGRSLLDERNPTASPPPCRRPPSTAIVAPLAQVPSASSRFTNRQISR